MDKHNQRLIEASMRCYLICMRTIKYCLQREDLKNKKELTKKISDCAGICRSTAYMVLSVNESQWRIWEECRDVCMTCARAVEKIKGDIQIEKFVKACKEFDRTYKMIVE